MGVYQQMRAREALERLGFVDDARNPLKPKAIMAHLGAIAGLAFMSTQNMSDKDYARRAHDDIPAMDDRAIYRELQQALFVLAWDDEPHEWIAERIQMLQAEQRRQVLVIGG